MSSGDEANEDRGFVVIDRRASAGARDAGAAPEAPPTPGPEGAAGPPEAVDFAVLVYSFATSALFHMGFATDPETGQAGQRNLPLARQNIEILALIERKTRGNLEAEEARLLEGLLYEVRMRFVEASRA